MRKFVAFLFLFTITVQSQNTFDEIKNLTVSKKNDIEYKLGRIKTFAAVIPNYKNSQSEKTLDNLGLFIRNPFDPSITNFSLVVALKTLEEVILITPEAQVAAMIKGDPNKGTYFDTDKDGITDNLEKLEPLTSVLPTGYSLSTKMIDAVSKFLVERTKQELTLTFYENFKGELEKDYTIKIDDTHSITFQFKNLFPNTYLLFKSKNYFETPSLGQTWIIAFNKDLNALPFKIEEQIRSTAVLSNLKEFHFAVVSYDLLKEIKNGVHPSIVLMELNERYNVTTNYVYEYEIDKIIGLLHLLSENLSKEEPIGFNKVRTWINSTDLSNLTEEQTKYLIGAIYQMGRANGLFSKLKINTIPIENLITQNNYKLLYTLIRKTVTNFTSISNKLDTLKQDSQTNEVKKYIDYLSAFYCVFDQVLENYYTSMNSTEYYNSDYYLKYKRIADDIILFNKASNENNYAECLLITTSFLQHLIPKLENDNEIIKKITFCGNFMIDVLNTAKNNGDLKLVIEKYVMPVSSYRIKRQFKSSWDVNAYPGLYLSYEFSGSNSLSYGVTAPIGFSYSFKNKNKLNTDLKSSSSTLFLSVIDIGAPFSYRFTTDEAEGLPEDIKWEQVFSPGFFYIYGLSKSPLSLGISAQFSPLLRKISTNNELDSKNIFRIGLSLLVDIPLFNLKTSTK